MKHFIKSADTSKSVESSRAELNKLLGRYGCTAFGYDQDNDGGVTRVTFRVPNSPAKDAAKVPVQLEVRPLDVYVRLYGQPTTWVSGKGHVPTKELRYYNAKKLQQAERVAWRHLLLWVDAACSASSAGLATIEEAFFAHRLVEDRDGRVGRVIDFMHSLASGEGGPKLLGSGS